MMVLLRATRDYEESIMIKAEQDLSYMWKINLGGNLAFKRASLYALSGESSTKHST